MMGRAGNTACALAVGLALAGTGATRAPVARDVEGYAIATCLARQASPYLKDQADGWGSIIVQRGHGGIEPLRKLADVVRAEATRAPPYQIEDEQSPAGVKAMPIAYCAEIIDRPAVRAAVTRAEATLGPAYRRRR